MACNANKANILRIVAARPYSAQAAHQHSAKSLAVQTTALPNKLVVATAESSLPVSRVSVLFRAGSRNESYDNLGASHVLRTAAGLTTKRSTTFAITRHIQQAGGALTVTGDREAVAFTVELTADKLETGLQYLQDVATAPAFKPWEIAELTSRVKVELAAVSDQVTAVELLHKAAYRSGLGNSVFCPSHNVGKISSEALQHFFASNCTTNRCAVVGVGVDHRLLVGYAQSFEIESGAGKDSASKYHSGEIRMDKRGNIAHVAVAGEGAAVTNLKEAAAFAVLQYAAGVKAAAKRGNINGALGKAVASAVQGTPYGFRTLNASYTDSGIFGFVISADGRHAGKAVEAAVKALKSGSISADDVNRAKSQLKASVLRQHNRDAGLLSDIGSQAILLGTANSADIIVAAIESVSPSDVSAAARKVASSKLSMGAVGNLANVPYLSDLN